jgi:cobalt/nickel transport system permease protein
MEGFLPQQHALLWMVVMAPFAVYGLWKINKLISRYPERKLLLGMATAFVFVLSALKMPSVTGSSSHATGIGLAAIMFGPGVAGVLAGIVLLFQALLLAHGGLTTWGANTFSMGVAGGFVAYITFKGMRAAGLSEKIAVFFAAALADLATYMVTAGQLSLAFPDTVGGVGASFFKFAGIFAFTQLPLAISEGLLSVVVYNTLLHYNEQGLIRLWWKEGEHQG